MNRGIYRFPSRRGHPEIIAGNGSPEGALPARPGRLYVQLDAITEADGLWFKRSGTGATGWRQVTTGGGGGGGGGILSGTGSPEGVETADVGTLYVQTNESPPNDALWYKRSGSGATGWVQVIASAAGGASYEPAVPDSISDLYRWFKADAGITKDGSDKVSAWTDQSGLTGGDATQATSGNQPTWVDNVVDGSPVVRFTSGSSTNLGVDLSGIAGSGYTFFIVEGRGVASTGNIVGSASASSTNNCPHIGYNNTVNFVANQWGNDLSFGNSTPPFGSGFFLVWTVVLNTSQGRKIELLRGDRTAFTGNTTTLGSVLGGGKIGQAVGRYYTGDIPELIVYTRDLDFDERRGVEAYLYGRYPSTRTLNQW